MDSTNISINNIINLSQGGNLRITNSKTYNQILASSVFLLRSNYYKNGNSQEIQFLSDLLISFFKQFKYSNDSFYFSQLLSINTQMILNTASSKDQILVALDQIEKAISILLNINEVSYKINKELVKNILIYVVSYKAVGNYNESFRVLSSMKDLLLSKRGMNELNLVSLDRQFVIMSQDVSLYKKLLTNTPLIKNLFPIEYYSNIKRILEFSLNNKLDTLSDKLVKEYDDIFRIVRKSLPEISLISYLKNKGQYLYIKNNSILSIQVLKAACAKADELKLNGQIMQIVSMLEQAEGGNDRLYLSTFKV